MSDERTRRVVHNEALFRQTNESIEDLNEEMEQLTGAFAVVCECGDLECTEQLRIEKSAYEHARSRPVWFLVCPGHELPEVEHVVHVGDGYVLVEKDPPEARAIATETADGEG